MWELSLYELNRSPQEPITDDTEIAVSPRGIQNELMCPICLGILKKTMASKECLHRFCSDCIVTALRSGNKECPTCRKKLVSERSLLPDPNFDFIISKIYPNRDEYEAHQTKVMEELNESCSQANLVHSIHESIKLQTQNSQNLQQRTKNNQLEEPNESSLSTISKPLNSSSQDNLIRKTVQTKVLKKMKFVMISEKESSALTVDTLDITECGGTSKSVPVDEIEIVLKPHLTVVSNNPFFRVLKENSVHHMKTTANATVNHLSKYLAMQLKVDLGFEIPEQALNYFIHDAPTADQFLLLEGNQTFRNVLDKFWKVNKPLEMFYSFT
ncbi:hypothetical protein QTP88_011114 [Uroleucon formosanum]